MKAVAEIIFAREPALEGGFTAHALGASTFTEGGTVEEIRANVVEAVHCHFDEGGAPAVFRLHSVRDDTFAV